MDFAPDQIRMPFPEAPAFGQALELAPGILWLRLPLADGAGSRELLRT